MRGSSTTRFMLVLPMLLLAAAAVPAGQVVSTATRGVNAVMQAGNTSIRPVGTAQAMGGDLAPVQLFEIARPMNQPLTIGRMFTSCTCVRIEADKRTFAPGEPAIVRMRNVLATPPQGQNYAIYIQISSPVNATLRHDTFVRSAQFIPASHGQAPTRGDIKADGVLAGATLKSADEIEVIVPKADNYVPDTSEYTLKKQAEAKVAELAKKPETEKDTAKSGVPSKSANDPAAPKRPKIAAAAQAKAEGKTVVEKAKDRAEKDIGKTAAVADAAKKEVVDVAEKTETAVENTVRASSGSSREIQGDAKRTADDLLKKSDAAVKTAEKAVADKKTEIEAFADKGAAAAKQQAENAENEADSLWKEVAPKSRAVEKSAAANN